MAYQRKPPTKIRQSYEDVAQSDLGYIAGLLDGEGSINILRMAAKRSYGTYTHYAMQIRIGNTDLAVLEWLQTICGGTVYLNHGIKKDGFIRRPCYAWWAGGRAAKPFLEAMLPYVRIKKKQIETALDFLTLGRAFVPEVRAEFYQLMGQLNFRKSSNKTADGSASVTNKLLQ